MDVFEIGAELEAALGDFGGDLVQTVQDGITIIGGHDLLIGQHAHMGARSCNILCCQLLVEADGGIDRFHDLGGCDGKPPTPHGVTGRGFVRFL